MFSRVISRIIEFLFYRSERVGKDGKRFRLWKFRTMVQGADSIGGYSVAWSDNRITKVGSFLRRWHLDEIPNLVNVVKGEMNLIGPRPDVPYYADRIPEPQRSIILSVKPGCLDMATMWDLDEGEQLHGKPDPEKYYEEVIWPEKLRLQVSFIERCSGSGFLKKAFSLLFSKE